MKCLKPAFSADTALQVISLGSRSTLAPVEIDDLDAGLAHLGDLALLEEHHLARVRQDRRHVGGDEVLAVAEPEHQRRGVLGGDDLSGAVSVITTIA